MTEVSPAVGRTQGSRNPWAARSRRYPASVRSRPPATTINVQVDQLAERLPVAVGQDFLDDHQSCSGRHRAAEVVEDAAGLGVVPVVQDVAEQVGVGAAGAS